MSKQTQQNRESLVIAPFFRIETPPLGIACLQAYLKQFDIHVDFTDFRLKENGNDITSSNVGYKYNHAGDLQDLPLIQTVAANFLNTKPLLDDIDKAVRKYVDSRPLGYFTIKEDIADIYRIFNQELKRLSQYSLVGFTTYATNIFFSVLLACMLKQAKPGITVIFGGPQVSESELTSEILLRLKIVDAVAIGDGEETLRQIIEADRAEKSLAVDGAMTVDFNTGTLVKKPAPRLNIQTLPCPDFPVSQSIVMVQALPPYHYIHPVAVLINVSFATKTRCGTSTDGLRLSRL